MAWLFYLHGGVMRKRDEIVAEIKRIAEKLGRAPSKAELCTSGRISWHQVYKHFRGMRAAVRAAGLEPGPRGCPADENVMVLDWGRVVRELGRLPSRAEYDERGKHHSVTLHARLGWSQMAHRFVLLVREFHLEKEWKDVVEVVWGKFPLLARVATGRWQLANGERSGDREIGTSGDWKDNGGRICRRMDGDKNPGPQRTQSNTEEGENACRVFKLKPMIGNRRA
jgi:hypothetical protein